MHFERVLLTGKAFDMVFVMKVRCAPAAPPCAIGGTALTRRRHTRSHVQKGFHAPASKKEYVRVSMIPMKSLEDIKAWLTDVVELVRVPPPRPDTRRSASTRCAPLTPHGASWWHRRTRRPA